MKLKYITLTFLFMLFFVACDESFLDKQPIDSVTPEEFYSDGDNLSVGLVGVYDGLQTSQVFGNLPILDGISDNVMLVSESPEIVSFSTGSINSNVTGEIASYYLNNYQVIQRANLLLDNIGSEGTITEEERNVIEAEARGLRAMAYFRLVYLFGDLPLVTTTLSREESLSLFRTSKEDIITFILEELTIASSNLSSEPYNGEIGRLTSQALIALKARIMLYEARFGNVTWEEALEIILQAKTQADSSGANLVNIGGSGLENYEAVFSIDNEQNEEILFAVGFDSSTLSEGQSTFAAYSIGDLGGRQRMIIHSNFINDFYTIDGLPITDLTSIYNENDPYQNRDPRLQANLYVSGLEYQYLGDIYYGDATYRKFGPSDLVTETADYDMPVLRYAELLLMVAEAENEVNGGPNTVAYEAINAIRQRVNMPDVTENLTIDEFRDVVIHERRIELAFEGHRWFDLITLGLADEKINSIEDGSRAFVVGTQELFPIPQSEIDLNANLLPNNPGYN